MHSLLLIVLTFLALEKRIIEILDAVKTKNYSKLKVSLIFSFLPLLVAAALFWMELKYH